MVFRFYVSTIMVWMMIQIHLLRGADEDCMDAVYNAKVVKSCPTSKVEWDIAARRKNCSKLAAEAERKNCTINEKQPEYHCLINALRNKLLEVCASGKTIFGYCTEFNEAGKVIQNHYTAPCKDVSPKCDKSYKSSDAYKYTGCYELVSNTQVSTDVESGDPEIGYDKMTIIITTCIIVIVLCSVAVTKVLCLIRRKKEKRKRKKYAEEGNALKPTTGTSEKTTNKEADSEPSIQYFVCKIKKFRHLYNFIKQIKEIMQRILEKENKSNDLADKVTEGGVIIFGVIGKITDKDHLLFPKGTKRICQKNENKNLSEAVPVLCMQNNLPLQSALEACHKENACHLILVQPVQDVADKADDFIKVIDRNKKTILEAITSCLELTQCNMLRECSHLYPEDSVILGKVEALYKKRLILNNTSFQTT